MEQAMRDKRISYRGLGFLVDKDAAYLWRVAKGERKPSRHTALAIGKALGINPMLVLQAGTDEAA